MTRKPRTTIPAKPSQIIGFPDTVLVYLEVAVEGPLAPGGIAHRRIAYPITHLDRGNHRRVAYLIGAACGPTTSQPKPGNPTNTEDVETVPVTVCQSSSAAFAQQHQVTRCTNDACFPLRPDEPQPTHP